MTTELWQSPKPETDQLYCWQCRQWWKWHPAFGSCLDSECTPDTWNWNKQNSDQNIYVCTYQEISVAHCSNAQQYLSCLWSVIRPVEQPRLRCAGQCSAEFVSFNCNGGILKLFPSKIPLSSTTSRDGIAVHGRS